MSKVDLKERIKSIKGPECSISGELLPGDSSLYDTHRKTPKRKNGTYTTENTDLALPVEHMHEHGTFREREEAFDTLKAMVDDRSQLMKLSLKISNQLKAYERGTDHPRETTVSFLNEQLKPIQKELLRQDLLIKKQLKNIDNPLAVAALGVTSVGFITVAYCLVYIDIAGFYPKTYKNKKGKEIPHPLAGQEKCRHASSLWAYCGLDKPSHARYEKGVAGGGNKTLRTALYNMSTSQMKNKKAPYRPVYDRVKNRLEHSEKQIISRGTDGKQYQTIWKDTKPSHRHGAALRAVMKHFLADYWFVGRTLAGLPTSALYPEAMLGGTHRTIMPEERGWVY